ncbi:hypothetical protein QHH03_31550, partial [Aphanizomenon sp. 202]|nr:hypothetical protein [Aphanizomenon sp. 202]
MKGQSSSSSLQLELSPPPVAALSIISDLVSSTVPNPWGNRPVLFHFLCQLGLNAESLVGSHGSTSATTA